MTPQWQPIETAEGGKRVLVAGPYDAPVTENRFWIAMGERVRGMWMDDEHVGFPIQPTHWMPLPDPPSGDLT